MAAQVQDVVRDALGHLGVVDANNPVREIDMRDGIRALNLMMRAWETDGVAMGWSDVNNPTDPLPAPPEAEEAIGYNLAVRLRARYRIAIDPDVIALARDGLATLSAQLQAVTYERTEYPDLPAGVRGIGYGWRSGYYGR